MLCRVARERRVFLACPRPVRILLVANMIFALVLPVIDIFTAAYVMRNSHDVGMVVMFQLAVYTGIPLAFLANGFLLKSIASQHLYAAGMLLCGASLAVVMFSSVATAAGIAGCGLFMGVA